jgi:hypothetical protein
MDTFPDSIRGFSIYQHLRINNYNGQLKKIAFGFEDKRFKLRRSKKSFKNIMAHLKSQKSREG